MSQAFLDLGLGIPDKVLGDSGAIRSYSGTVLEEVVKKALCLDKGITNGQASTCPDAYTPTCKALPCEIKSLKRGTKMVVYDWRMAKEARHCLYFIGVHKRKAGAKTLAAIWQGFSDTLQEVLILTAREVEELALKETRQKIKKAKTRSGVRNGYQRKGYKDGYRNVPFKAIRARVLLLPFQVSCVLHSLPFQFRVRISREALFLTNYVQEA